MQEVINSASGLLKVLNEDLQDCSGKLLELVETAGANFMQYGEFNQTTGNLPAQVGTQNIASSSVEDLIHKSGCLRGT